MSAVLPEEYTAADGLFTILKDRERSKRDIAMPKYPAARYGRLKYGSTDEGRSVYRTEKMASAGQVDNLQKQLGAKPRHTVRYSTRAPLSDSQRKAIFAKGKY